VDKAMPKKKWIKKRIVTTVGVTALVVLIISSYFITSGKSRVNVKTDRISINEIKKGAFQEFMRGMEI
jgi:HlyD family secretion protein